MSQSAPTVFAMSITASSEGEVQISVPAGRFRDADGNDNLACSVFSWTYDTTKPTCGTTGGGVTNGGSTSSNPIVCTFDWDEPVTGFTSGDVVCGNGTISDFTQVSSTQWTCNVTASGPGVVSISIPSSSVTDDAGNANSTTGQFLYTYTSVE